MKVEADVIAEDIPLLLSKNSLKKADAIVDMKNDKAFIFGKEVKLHLSTSGHYCIDIDPSTGKIDALPDITEIVFVLESSLSHSDKVKQVEKLHKQFGHTSTENLKRLIKNTGEQGAGLMKIIDEVVQACRKYKKIQNEKMSVENTRNLYQDQLWDCQEPKISIILLHLTCMSWDQMFGIFI